MQSSVISSNVCLKHIPSLFFSFPFVFFFPKAWDKITNLPASNEISIWSGTRPKVHCTPLFARSPNPPSFISFHKRFQCRAAIQSWGKGWPDHDKTWCRKVKQPSFQTKHLLGLGTNINLCSLFCSWCVIWFDWPICNLEVCLVIAIQQNPDA